MRTLRRMRSTWDAAAALGGDALGARDRAVPQLESLFRRLGSDARGSGPCVEVGCGGGRMTVELARRFPEVIAVDVSPRLLELTAQEVAAHGLENVRLQLVRGDALDGVATGSAATLVCYGVLQHVPSRRIVAALFREFARVLAGDGEAFVQLPVLEPGWRARSWRLMRTVATALESRLSRDVRRSAGYRGTRLTNAEVERLLLRAGLRAVARADGGAEGLAATLSRYAHSREVVLRLAPYER